MTLSRLYLSPPHLDGDELRLVTEAFACNWIAPLGPHVDAFEHEMCLYTGATHAAALSSGTAALHLALRLLGISHGDEVWCSSFTFAASANPICYERATPVFLDSEERSWNLDPALLAQSLDDAARLGRLPKAIIAVHLYGQCADIDLILAACRRHHVPLIEDAAEAVGSLYKGRHAGSLGDLSVLSFNGNKIITTSGGGMLLSPDAGLVAQARFLATQARDPAPHYQHSHIGFNYRMSNILAGIGRGQLARIEAKVAARRRICDLYQRLLANLPGIRFMPEADFGDTRSRANRWLTCILIDPVLFGTNRETVRMTLEAANIECRPLWKPLHMQPVFAGSRMIGGAICERLFDQGLCLPSGSAMSDQDVKRIADIIRKCCAYPNG